MYSARRFGANWGIDVGVAWVPPKRHTGKIGVDSMRTIAGEGSAAVAEHVSGADVVSNAQPRTTGAAERAAEMVAAGLASIATERSGQGIYRAACDLAMRLPGIGGSAVLRPDERGLLTAVHAKPSGIPADLVQLSSQSLHKRWIASHAPGASHSAMAPYTVEERPELLIVPLVSGDSLLGGLVFAAKAGTIALKLPAERVSAAAIGSTTSQALENAVLRHRLDMSISRADHESELMSARKTIGRELHDGPTQDLALAGLTLDRLITALGEDQAISADARQARDLIDRAVVGMRKSIGKLRSAQPPAPSITGPLRELLAEMEPGSAELQVDFQAVSGVRLAPEVERAMIGIVREALHNVRKHANADSVRLEVRRIDDAVEIAVTDDGIGIQGNAPAGHFGLEQIKELAEETGGKLEIGRNAGAGTSVKAWIPLASPPGTELGGVSKPPSRLP